MINKGRVNLLGIQISAVDYESAVNQILEGAQQGRPFGVSALAVHGVMTGFMDPEHRHRLNSLELLAPDGQPVRWGINLLHRTRLSERVYGPNLMLKVCEAAAKTGTRICLFGGKAELLNALSTKLLQQFPDLKIAATIPSRFRTLNGTEKQELVKQIKDSGAQITFCGLGCPRQEVWTYEFKDVLSMPVIAVGAAFNFHAGELEQAPSWMQRWGLEWFFRLTREPLRLWKRYLILNPYYLFLLGCQKLGFRKFDPRNCQVPQKEVGYG